MQIVEREEDRVRHRGFVNIVFQEGTMIDC